MNKSDSIAELAKALAAAQGEFEAVEKNADNPFFHSKYADLPAVVMAASPILSKHGLAVSQLPDFDGTNDLLTTIIMHSSGEWIEATMRLYLAKPDPQAQGSATTYGRRYSYSGGVGIVTEADDDGNAATASASSASPSTTRREAPARTSAPSGAKTYLTVPFEDKDAAKALGARWDKDARQPGSDKLGRWYVPEGKDLAQFRAWLPAESPEAGVEMVRAAFRANEPPPLDEPPPGMFDDEEVF